MVNQRPKLLPKFSPEPGAPGNTVAGEANTKDDTVLKDEASNGDEHPEDPPRRTGPSRIVTIGMLVVALIGIFLILWAWRLWPFTSAVVVTENAYVRGRVTSLAPQVNGYVVEVRFRDYERVRAGQVLFVIDQRLYRQQVARAQAALDQTRANFSQVDETAAQNEASIEQGRADVGAAEAERFRADVDARRVAELASRGSVSLRERDSTLATARASTANVVKARAAQRSAEAALKATRVRSGGLAAGVAAAQADLKTAQINLSNTVIRAPVDGQVSEASIRAGQYAAAGSQLTYLVGNDVWVVANFKETQVRRMRVGQSAWFTADALGDEKIQGEVEQIAPATGSEFSVLRPDNASGNFTKVVQRLPVRIRIKARQAIARRLRPGLSVIVRVDTGAAGEQPVQ